MLQSLGLAPLFGVFIAAAAAIWVAGVQLTRTTDVLSQRFGLGQALGGAILLAIATNLPEIAITVSASAAGQVGVAIGNILGGIAIQTVVLVGLDVFGMREKSPLTYRAASLTLVIEGLLVIAVLLVAIMGTQLPESLIFARIGADAGAIALIWLIGLWLIGRANKDLPWQARDGPAPALSHAPQRRRTAGTSAPHGGATARTGAVFLVAAAVTLVAGVILERAGSGIAARLGMDGVLFAATVLAAATSLPELSTGLASTRARDYQLAVSDIFGGNAFLPVLFLLATLISGRAVLPQAQATDIYLAGLGGLLTAIYVTGLIFRPRRRVLGMGVDSLSVFIVYLMGTAGLVAIALDR